MNPLIFPKMLTSHGEGWDWLMRIHPSITKIFFAYVVPMSLIPPAMLMYAWRTYTNAPLLEITLNQALVLAVIFYATELVVVPVMGRVVQKIGEIADSYPPYENTFALATVVPTPLWLAPLALFVPSLVFNIVVMLLALAGAAALIYQGVDRVFRLHDEGRSRLLAGTVLAAGLVAWVSMMVLAFVSWGWVLT